MRIVKMYLDNSSWAPFGQQTVYLDPEQCKLLEDTRSVYAVNLIESEGKYYNYRLQEMKVNLEKASDD